MLISRILRMHRRRQDCLLADAAATPPPIAAAAVSADYFAHYSFDRFFSH
jgi:hypothetical protein